MRTKSKKSYSIENYKVPVVALVLVIALSIGAGLYFLGFESPSSDENSGPQVGEFEVLANIGDASLTTSGTVSSVGVDVTNTNLQTLNQSGSETVEYSLTVSQTTATVTGGGGSPPSGYGDQSVTSSGVQSASISGSESYGGTTMNDDLSINLSDAGASSLATDVNINSGQTVEFTFSTDGSATLKDSGGSILDTASTSGSAVATVASTATINSFGIDGNLQLQE